MSIGRKIGMGVGLLGAKIRGERLPLIVNWAITGRCNLRCPHCYGSYGTVQNTEISTEEVFRIIDDLKAAGTRRVTIEGGEPLLRRDIGQVIDRLADRGMEFSLCTNGVLFKNRLEMLKGKVDLVVFSLDGDEEAHDRIRGRSNFQTVVEAVQLARSSGMRTLVFSTMVDGNMGDLDRLMHLARELDTSITFNVAVAQLDPSGERTSIPKDKDRPYKDAMRKVLEYKKQGFPVFYTPRSFEQVVDWPSLAKEKLFASDLNALPDGLHRKLVPCHAGRFHAYIECTGEVYPCYQTVGTLPVRNALEVGFKSAFDHLATLDYCRHCYNVTISEANLQCDLNPGAVAKVLLNYAGRRS